MVVASAPAIWDAPSPGGSREQDPRPPVQSDPHPRVRGVDRGCRWRRFCGDGGGFYRGQTRSPLIEKSLNLIPMLLTIPNFAIGLFLIIIFEETHSDPNQLTAVFLLQYEPNRIFVWSASAALITRFIITCWIWP